MALVNLPNLYCLPSDLYDFLGSEGAQLRLDDHNQATGQIVQTTADAALGATTLAITALQKPILRGTVLLFDGAGMETVVEATLTATAIVGATSLTVDTLSAGVNAQAQARDSGVNVALAARLVKGCSYATAQVKLYCCPRYDDSQLAQSWSVNRWATVLGSRWVAKRLSRACPAGIEKDYEEVIEELKGVRMSFLNIEDIGTRTSGWPFISNVSVNLGYDIAKVRVEPQISEATPTQYGQFVDWNAVMIAGVEW